ncbi:MAG: isoprenyl transferase [bacterium]|nr:isoprenyl transferase [bacterium]
MKGESAAEERLARERLPRHVAVIMDGNGRWARERGLSRIRGHRAGAESIREIVRTAGELGIGYLTLYAFSIENWKRPKREVASLMALLKRYLRRERAELDRNNVRLRVIGRIAGLPEDVRGAIRDAVRHLDRNTGLTLVLALNYGGRGEITDAVRALCRRCARGEISPEAVDEATISSSLDTAGMPDPDLLIRTSGEMRVSNFLLWQISYAEIHVTPVYWPDFRRGEFIRALLDYQGRERRFGGVGEAADPRPGSRSPGE